MSKVVPRENLSPPRLYKIMIEIEGLFCCPETGKAVRQSNRVWEFRIPVNAAAAGEIRGAYFCTAFNDMKMEEKSVMAQYNHTAIESKWRARTGKRIQSMSMMERKRSITVWICSRIRPAVDFM